ncbi:MAG TPA: hypothetical protein VMF69_21350 [Gemmataceae bacterium]|nr:hypothetical protein [Gemmataceae bacterium]
MIHSIDSRRSWEMFAEGLIVIAAMALAAFLARPYAGSWNDGSRLATVESLIDQHTWIIDRSIFVEVPKFDAPLPYPPGNRALLEHGTQDKLFINGHYCSDKSPVPALLMAGYYQLWQWATGMTARTHPDRFCWAMTLASSGAAYVAAIWCMYRLARRLSLPFSSRLLLTASFALATVALPYARQVNNHVLLLAVASALVLGIAGLPPSGGKRQPFTHIAALGFLAGLGYTIDLGDGPVILLCTAGVVLIEPFRRVPKASVDIRARLRNAAKRTFIFAAAALPWLILHHALNYAIGGSFKPANANPEYFRWPGSPFVAGNLTGSWIHPHAGSFLLYAASMLAGKRGFLGHNLPLFLTIPALFVLLWHHREIRREVLWAAGCCAGVWLLYAATSNNSSGQCCTIRWFVPLLAPAYFVLALLLRHYPRYRLDLLLLSGWGTLLVMLMREGPWMGGMVPFFWPIQAATLGSWGLCHYLRCRNMPDRRLTISTFAASNAGPAAADSAIPPSSPHPATGLAIRPAAPRP